MLASIPNRRDQFYELNPPIVSIQSQAQSQHLNQQTEDPNWPNLSSYFYSANSAYPSNDQSILDCYPLHLSNSVPVTPLMQADQSSSYYSSRSHNIRKTRANQRDYPISPYTANTSNPQIVGDIYDFQDMPLFAPSKPLTPVQTPSEEGTFIVPQYTTSFQNSPNIPIDILPIADISYTDKPAVPLSFNHGLPNTPPNAEEERQNHIIGSPSPGTWIVENMISCDQGYKKNMADINQGTINEVFEDDLYHNGFQVNAQTPRTSQNETFEQRLKSASDQHLRTTSQTPLIFSGQECTPFQNGSPLTSASSFLMNSPSLRIGTASHLRERQKAESDAQVLREQLRRGSTIQESPTTVTTISPKDVDLVFHDNEEETLVPLFPVQHRNHNLITEYHPKQESVDSDDGVSQRSYGNMVTTRCESSSTYATSLQPVIAQQNNFRLATPSVESAQCMPQQQYSFLPQICRQSNGISNAAVSFPPESFSMDSGSSKTKKPLRVLADTGTYTCTYHGCTLRFDTPARLQRHKREGHRNPSAAAAAAATISAARGGMTSAAQRNSQAGPHKCDRINPSTGKPCKTIFSRPYDLTRHEDTIHNTQKQKVYCPLCEEEKSFSRNDALTRHMRVVHPDSVETSTRRRQASAK